MRKLQTFGEYEEEYYRKHPEEIDSYLKTIFEEWAKDGDTGALLASLRTICRVKGISALAEETGMSRQGIQHALSEQGNPRLETLNAILQAMGYRLVPEKLKMSAGK
jgi:probable addiction module antidote protein